MIRISLLGSIVLLLALAGSVTGFSLDDAATIFGRDVGIDTVDDFSRHETHVQRILAISSSTTSIVFCVASMYMFFAIDPRRLVFRHQLIFFLLFFDLVKACILLLYPSRVLNSYTAYFSANFCHVVGFFTATAIEGADFAILTFAIHTYLLIFRPSLNVRVGNSRRVEGGLYRYRFYIYGTSFLVPIILASLAFVNDQGYVSFVTWCYLPQRPIWYRMVLSWVPRYIIIATIFTCYSLIYFHVIRQIRTLGGVFTTSAKARRDISDEKPSFYSALKYFFNSVKDNMVPKFTIPENNKKQDNYDGDAEKRHGNHLDKTESNIGPKQSLHSHGRKSSTHQGSHSNILSSAGDDVEFEYDHAVIDDDETMSNDRARGKRKNSSRRRRSNSTHSDIASSSSSDDDDQSDEDYTSDHPNDNDIEEGRGDEQGNVANNNIHSGGFGGSHHVNHETDIHLENLKQFRRRQRIIKKQMKSIFIYPVAYIFLWLFPFILYVTQLNYMNTDGPIYWINCMGAFMQPLNGFVDSLVFFYRETPWKYTAMKKFEKDHADKMDTVLTKHRESHSHYDSSISTAAGGPPPPPPPPLALRLRSKSVGGSQNHSHLYALTGSGAYMQGGQPYGPNSLSADLGVDIVRFKKWRRFLNDIHLPLFELPTEGNLLKLQKKYLSKKRIKKRQIEADNATKQLNSIIGPNSQSQEGVDGQGGVSNGNTHDYSNVLGGGLAENEFRNLENFSLNFKGESSQKPNSVPSSTPSIINKISDSDVNPRTNMQGGRRNSAASQSNRSFRSRQYSIIDPNEPVILENKQYDTPPSTGSPTTPTNIKHHGGHHSPNNTLNIKRGNSGSSSPNKKLSRSTLDTRQSTNSETSEDEMDFLEFLRKGPP